MTLDGKTLRFALKEPFEAIKEMVETRNWYTQLIKGGTTYILIWFAGSGIRNAFKNFTVGSV